MELQEIKSALDKITDQVKEQGEKALAEAKSAGSLAQKTKELVDDLLLQKNELTERVKAVEQAATETFVGQPAQKSGGVGGRLARFRRAGESAHRQRWT